MRLESLVVKFIIGVFIFLLVVAVLSIAQEVKLTNKYTSGQITLAQYCDERTNHGTLESIPVICYEYYKVKPVGTKNVCGFNPATKTTMCQDRPILEAE